MVGEAASIHRGSQWGQEYALSWYVCLCGPVTGLESWETLGIAGGIAALPRDQLPGSER